MCIQMRLLLERLAPTLLLQQFHQGQQAFPLKVKRPGELFPEGHTSMFKLKFKRSVDEYLAQWLSSLDELFFEEKMRLTL